MNRKYYKLNNLVNSYEECDQNSLGLMFTKCCVKSKGIKICVYDVNLYVVKPGILIGFSCPVDQEVNSEFISNLHF